MDSKQLAEIIEQVGRRWAEPDYSPRREATDATLEAENRFTPEAIIFAINQQARQLTSEALLSWTGSDRVSRPHSVFVVNPGNVPFAGLQDFLAVILVGHRYRGKMSSRSPDLLKSFANDLIDHGALFDAELSTAEPAFQPKAALIASGSDRTMSIVSRTATDAGIPAERILLRGHRFSAAVIGAMESMESMNGLAEDILLHEGLGCRNVALVWAPENASPDALIDAMARFRAVFPAHPETSGGLKMQIAFYRAADLPHAYAEDESFLISRGDPEVQRPGHVRWAEYRNLDEVRQWLHENAARLQLVVAPTSIREDLNFTAVPCISPGDAQRPALGWSHSNGDLIRFLRNL